MSAAAVISETTRSSVEGRAHRLVLFGLMFSVILPGVRLGPFHFSVAYIGVLLLLPFVLVQMEWPKRLWVLPVLAVCIIAQVALSSVLGPLIFNVTPGAPLETVQYVVIFGAFLIWFTATYKGWVTPRFVLVCVLVVGFLAMLIGLLQWLPVSWNRALWALYSYSESQAVNYSAPLPFRRVPGVAHMATANGGIAAFFFVFAVTVALITRQWRVACVIVMILAVFNTIASQARMGYVTIAFGIFVIYVLGSYLNPQRFWRYSMWLIGGVVAVVGAIVWLLESENALLVQAAYRWTLLIDQVQSGENRIQQISQGFSLLGSPYAFLFGISSEVRQSIPGFFLEVEPIEIIVLYGAVGWLLQYGLVLYLLIYLLKQSNVRGDACATALIYASFACLLCYQFFSLAYYFFKDVFVGTLPWMLVGAAVGASERVRSCLKSASSEDEV